MPRLLTKQFRLLLRLNHFSLPAILAGCGALGLMVFLGYALVFSTAGMGRAYRRARRWIEGALALIFGSAGLGLLLART